MPFVANPILRKELLTRLRSRKTFVALGLWIIVSTSVMSFGWASGQAAQRQSGRYRAYGTKGAVRTEQLVRAAYHSVSMGQLLLAAVLAPAFAVGAFTTERRQGTHDMLLTTPISPFGIAVAKFLSCACVMVLLAISSVPALSMVLLFGGVTGTELLLSAGVIVVAVLLFSAIGLFWSAWRRTTAQAALFSYLTIGALAALTVAPNKIWRRPSRTLRRPTRVLSAAPVQSWIEDTAVASPFSAALQLALAGGRKPALNPAIDGLSAQALAAWLLIVLTSVGVRRAREPAQPRGKPPISDERLLRERRTRFPFYLIDPLRRRAHIPDRANPVFVKEVRSILFRSGSRWVRVFYLSTLLHMVLVPGILASDYAGYSSYVTRAALPQCLVLMLLAPIAASGLFAREREAGTLDLLRATTLDARRVVWGKALAALAFGGLIVAGALLSWLVVAAAGLIRWYAFLGVATNVVGSSALAIALCTLVSASARRTVVAYPVSYGLMIAMLTVVPWWPLSRCLLVRRGQWPQVGVCLAVMAGYAVAVAIAGEAAAFAYRLRARD